MKEEAILAAGLLFQLAMAPRSAAKVCVSLNEEEANQAVDWREWTAGVRFGYDRRGRAVAACLSGAGEVIADPEHPAWKALASLAEEITSPDRREKA